MKILHLGKFYPMNGGMEKAILDIVQDFSKRGIVCDLLCVATDKPQTVKLNAHGKIITTKSILFTNSTGISPNMIPTLYHICNQYDIIHIHCPNPMANIALFLSNYKGKVILHWHSDIIKQKNLMRLYKPLQSWLIHRADVIIGTSPNYIKESSFLQKVPSSKITIIPLGTEKIIPSTNEVKKIKNKFQGKVIIFALGRLVQYKGFSYLIEAAKYLDDNYIILIGGEGVLYDNLKNQIEIENLEKKVSLLGRIDEKDLKNYYGACDIFCLSSIQKTEAFGLVQIEAMSCGKPIVATKIKGSGVPWVNKDGYSGLNVETRNPRALAEAIIKITSSPKEYRKYSKQALLRYQDQFTKEHMLQMYQQVYESLLK